MPRKVRFGVLSAANIGVKKVIPGMQRSELCEIVALASRDLNRATEACGQLGIARAYGSYEALLADPEIDAVYNPLPNHLHVPWSIKAAEAGKHVLCEKPVGMNAAEAVALIAARDKAGVIIGEAFMVRSHPQWLRTRQIIRSGEIGELRTMHCVFSYFNRDAANIRNIAAYGGGALMDIGCYPIQAARWIFGAEPARVSATIDRDPEFGTDRTTSALLEFPEGEALFTVSTQMNPYQRMQFFGTKGRVEVEIPVNAPPDRETRIFVTAGADSRTETFPACDQYGLQGDDFARAILNGAPLPCSLEDALGNMRVIDAIFSGTR